MSTAHQIASRLLHEAEAFRPGSMDCDYRIRAAWKLDQMARGIPACDWTEYPPVKQERAA